MRIEPYLFTNENNSYVKGNTVNRVLISDFTPLTQNQIYRLTAGKKHWTEKREHLIKLAKNFGIIIRNDDELKYLIEVHCQKEGKRIKNQFFMDSQTGKLKTHFTPTDIKGSFTKIQNPVIGVKYHISWAFSGSVFKLVRVEGDICYLDNPKSAYGPDSCRNPRKYCKI